jgi:Spy/CpxP family protein refolding chaperone
MVPAQRVTWCNPKILLTLFLVFVSGALAGALTMRYGMQARVSKPAPYWKEGGKEISLQRFTRELSLTAQQAREMEAVLDDFMLYYQTLQTQMDEVRASGKERIMRVLSAEQKQKFEKMLAEIQPRPQLR